MKLQFFTEAANELAARVKAGQLSGWTLKSTAFQSRQRLYASPDGQNLACHQDRSVDGEEYKLSIFIPDAEDGWTGSAMMDLVPYRSIDQQLEEAIGLAQSSRNKAWKMAGPPAVEPDAVETCDPEIRENPAGVVQRIEEQFSEAFSKTSGCRLNSAELFVNYSTSAMLNSEGLAYETEQSELYLETAMEKAGGENDKEVHEHTTSVTVRDLDVAKFISDCALQVAVLGESREPASSDNATILIDKDALSQMFQAVVQQLNCTNEYLKLPFFDIGDRIGGGYGDELNVRLDPSIPCMVLSSAYGIDGLPARPGQLIENNEVKERIIGNRFGQYLGLKPNGLSGNIVIEPGSLNTDELDGKAYLQIIKFSSLLIDPNKLTWSSEIKLGRLVDAEGHSTLIKGGVVSGNLKENLTDCLLSSTLGTVNVPTSSYNPPLGYRGPDAMLITRGVSIAGETKGDA